ncbi:MAG: hypothetical protein GX592_09700 [Clostridiales bacterium]|nr:hypothetical protein [Clostridiales bacterium]
MKFSAVGFTCIDIYKNLNILYPTGNGVDLLFNLIEMVPEVEGSVVTAVGDDEYGRMLIAACERRGVDASHISVVPGKSTAVIGMLLNGRDRVHHRVERGVMLDYQPTGADMDFIRTRDCIHTDLSWRVEHLLADMRREGARIYFDFSKRHADPRVEKVLKNIDYGIFSFEEETEEVRALLRSGCGLGAKILLATFGEKGSLASDGTAFYRCPAAKAPEVVNTVGAGDAFGAGFLSGILTGKGIEESMLLGAKRASHVVGLFHPYTTLD